MPTRRQVIRAGLAVAAGSPLAAALYAWRIEPHWLEITEGDLPVAGLPPNLDGRTLAHLSDLHVGPKVDDDYVIETFRRVDGLGPDFVVVTGDWITYRGPEQFDQLRVVLQHLPHGRLATVGILGNHDYGFGWRMRDVGDEVAGLVRAAGVELLRDATIDFDGLRFLGLEDLWGPRFAPEAMLAEHGGKPAAVALCHNPDAADRPLWGGFRGWILAGHTHGGQCKPPFLPPPLLPVANRRYTAGEIDLGDGRRLHISRGIGHLLHVRFNVRPEVRLFRLRRAPDAGASSAIRPGPAS